MRTTFYITGEIRPENVNQFLWLAGEDLIRDVVISSPGGDIGLTYGMFDVIRFNDINTHVVGAAFSAAAVLLQAGTIRTMTNSSVLQFHAPPDPCTDVEMRLCSQLVEMIAQRTGLAVPEAWGLFDGKIIGANQAMELGLIDEIAEDAKWMRWVKDGKIEEQLPGPGITEPSVRDSDRGPGSTGEPETKTE
jgi:ATP-dependent protease ClpP protease subunit